MSVCLYPACKELATATLGLCKLHAYNPRFRDFRDALRQRKDNEALFDQLINHGSVKGPQASNGDDHDAIARMVSEGCPNADLNGDHPVAPKGEVIAMGVVGAPGGSNRAQDGLDQPKECSGPNAPLLEAPANYPLYDSAGNFVGMSCDSIDEPHPRTPLQELVDDIFEPLREPLAAVFFSIRRTGDHLTLIDIRTSHVIWTGCIHTDLAVLYAIVRDRLHLPESWPSKRDKIDNYFNHPARNLACELRAIGEQILRMVDTLADVQETRTERGVYRIYKAYGMKRSPLDIKNDKDAPPDLPPGTKYTLIPVFKRYLGCSKCELHVPLDMLVHPGNFKLSWLGFEFFGECPACGHSGKFEIIDVPLPRNPPFIKVWKPEELEPVRDDFTGEIQYIWLMPDGYRKRIEEGASFYLAHVPQELLQALREHKSLIIPANKVQTA
jgi:hypothetical protein